MDDNTIEAVQDPDVIAAIRDELGEEGITQEEQRVLDKYYPKKAPDTTHYANLADHLDRDELTRLTYDVLDNYETDLESRREWHVTEARGMKLCGVSSDRIRPMDFEGASDVIDSGLMEACTQFNARAMSELWPEDGPVKASVYGDADEQIRQRAHRQADFMNYQYTTHMPYAYQQMDKLTMRLPLSGSMFKKTYWSPTFGRMTSEMCEPADVVVPYSAEDMDTTPRFAHLLRLTVNEVKRRIDSGYYRDVSLYEHPDESSMQSELIEEIDRVDRQYTQVDDDDSGRHTIIEMLLERDLPIDKEKGRSAGSPYIVSVDWESQQCLAVRRGWHPSSKRRRRVRYMSHYRMFPGFGFYGFGYFHMIGSLAEASTASLRSLLDSAGFANLQGGFVSRDVGLTDGDEPLGMGQWKTVEGTAEDVRAGFHPIKYPEPSPTLMKLLEHLDGKLRRFAATTDLNVGDSNSSNMPVGTVLALIEQSTRLQAGVHTRLRNSQTDEMRILARANRDFLPEEYPYRVKGEGKIALRKDFDQRVDVAPVADATTVSTTQRMFRAQLVAERSDTHPGLYDAAAVERRLLESTGITNIDELLPDTRNIVRRDPVAEGQAMLKGLPVGAHADQDHEAHLLVHEHWFAELPQDMQQMFQGAYMAHQAEHMGWKYRLQIEQRAGVLLPPPGLDQHTAHQEEVSPEMENEVTAMVAQGVQGLAQERQALPPPPTPEEIEANAKAEALKMQAQAKIEAERMASEARFTRETEEAERREQRLDMEASSKISRMADEQEKNERWARQKQALDLAIEREKAEEKRIQMSLDAKLKRDLDAEAAAAKAEFEEEAEKRKLEGMKKEDALKVSAQERDAQVAEQAKQAKESARVERVAQEEREVKESAALKSMLTQIESSVSQLAETTKANAEAIKDVSSKLDKAEKDRKKRQGIALKAIDAVGDDATKKAAASIRRLN